MYFIVLAVLLYCFSAASMENKQDKTRLNLDDVYKTYIKSLVNNTNMSDDKKVNAIMTIVEERCKHKQQLLEQIIAIQAFEKKQNDLTIFQLNKQLKTKDVTIELLMKATDKDGEKQRTSNNGIQNIVLGAALIGIGLFVVNTLVSNP